MAIVAFRTDPVLEDKLERAALRLKKTKTEVIREALETYLQAHGDDKPNPPLGRRLADALKTDIGMWEGPATASVNTGRQLGEILLEKYGTRRM
jgi:hypothetical protein